MEIINPLVRPDLYKIALILINEDDIVQVSFIDENMD